MQTPQLSSDITTDITLTLCSAVLLSTFLRYFKIPPILIYLLTGIIIGPTGVALVSDSESIHVIAEFGIVFLLFTLGLAFSPPKLLSIKRLVFGLGSIQVGVCFLLFFSVTIAYGLSTLSAILCAIVLALSSTAIVSKELTHLHLLKSRTGQISIGILLFQDLAAVLVLSLLPLWTANQQITAFDQLMILIKAGTFMACAMMMGRWILPALFTQIAHSRSQELFILTALTVAVASALITQRVGLSMSLGAFIAGMLLGESHYRHQIEADIRPFRDVLLGLFFISVGMLMDLNILQQYWFRILFFTLCMLLIKTLVVTVAVMVFKESKHNAIETGILLAQGGEFGFVLLALGAYYDLIPLDVVSFTLAIIIFSMMISSIMIRHCSTLTAWVARTIPGFKEALVIPLNTIKTITSTPHDHVMILGYGRIGQTIGRFLTRENIPFIAIDDDTRRVHDAITAGEPVIYGNATQYTLLEQAGLANAKLLIISFDDLEAALAITRQIRIHNTTLNVLVRTRDTSNLDELMRAGVSEVIPEILEASLMLVSQVLLNCKVSSKRVETLLSETRRAHYQQLHAFYQGDEVQSNTDYLKPKPCLHPIVIPENSYWIGQPLENIQKSLPHISVAGIKRLAQQHPMTPSETIQLEAHDTLILQGLSEHIERAEIELTAHTPPYSTT